MVFKCKRSRINTLRKEFKKTLSNIINKMTTNCSPYQKKLIKENERLCKKCNLLMKENAELKYKISFNETNFKSVIKYAKKKEEEVEALKEMISEKLLDNIYSGTK